MIIIIIKNIFSMKYILVSTISILLILIGILILIKYLRGCICNSSVKVCVSIMY